MQSTVFVLFCWMTLLAAILTLTLVQPNAVLLDACTNLNWTTHHHKMAHCRFRNMTEEINALFLGFGNLLQQAATQSSIDSRVVMISEDCNVRLLRSLNTVKFLPLPSLCNHCCVHTLHIHWNMCLFCLQKFYYWTERIYLLLLFHGWNSGGGRWKS